MVAGADSLDSNCQVGIDPSPLKSTSAVLFMAGQYDFSPSPQNEPHSTMSGERQYPELIVQFWIQLNGWYNYVGFATCALQAYEIALMWAEDVQFLWGRTRSLSTLLYILNRLTAVAFAVCGGVDFRATTVDICITINYALGITNALNLTMITLVSVIRVYAVSQRSWCLVGAASFLGLIPVSSGLYAAIAPKRTDNPQLGCVPFVASVPRRLWDS